MDYQIETWGSSLQKKLQMMRLSDASNLVAIIWPKID